MQHVYEDGYDAGLRAAALVAERMRDSFTQLGKDAEAAGAEAARARIQYEIDNP